MANKIMLKNVRLSFPSLFKQAEFKGEKGKFEATFLINKETQKELVSKLNEEMHRELAQLKMNKLSPDRIGIKDGDDYEYDGYAGHISVKASSNRRPTVVDRSRQPLVQEDGVIYPGCYVNAIIECWIQNNSYGKRVNFNLLGVQFFAEGDPLGGGGASDVTDDFETFDDIPF